MDVLLNKHVNTKHIWEYVCLLVFETDIPTCVCKVSINEAYKGVKIPFYVVSKVYAVLSRLKIVLIDRST